MGTGAESPPPLQPPRWSYPDHSSNKRRRLGPIPHVDPVVARTGRIARYKTPYETSRDVPSSDGHDIGRAERDPGMDAEMIDIIDAEIDSPPTNQATQGDSEIDTEIDTEIDPPPTNQATQVNSEIDSEIDTEIDSPPTNQAARGNSEIDTEIDSPPLPRSC
ncbi:hypothetical protein HOY82DRAFT_539347 [Tuber indicum]|nr:hypothetical protein HOY82DRAFT_539347 [Tuber indicum]